MRAKCQLTSGGSEPAAATLSRTGARTLPKNFHPVGTSNRLSPLAAATRSRAADVGMDRATPFSPPAKKGMASALAAMMATESEGVTKNCLPRIMLRSASPSCAAPKSGSARRGLVVSAVPSRRRPACRVQVQYQQPPRVSGGSGRRNVWQVSRTATDSPHAATSSDAYVRLGSGW